jgi:predicted Zn-dependent peptidase
VVAPARPSSITLKNGLRAHLVPGGGAGLVALRARVDLGPPSGAARAALVALVAARLARAAPGEPASLAALSLTLIDEPAAAVNTRWIELSARAMAEDLPSLLALVQARLTAGAAPLAEAEWSAVHEAAAQRASENLFIPLTSQRASAAARLYPAGSALAQPPWGNEDALRAAKPEQVLDAARTWLRPDRVQLALAGAVEAVAARRVLEATLGRWTAPGPPPPAPVAAAHPPPRTAEGWPEHGVSWPHKPQDDILVVWPGPARDTPTGRAATEALLYLLGETGYAGRLGRALVEPGLVYSVYATLEEAPGAPGFLAVRTASSRAHTREAVRRIREVLETAAQGAFTQAELDEARSYLRGRDALRREGSEEAARAALDDATLPSRPDPQALTLEQLNATARRLFARGAPLVLVLGGGPGK